MPVAMRRLTAVDHQRIESCVKMARSRVNRFCERAGERHRPEMQDLANHGLLVAAVKFDESRHAKYSTLAYAVITRMLRSYLCKQRVRRRRVRQFAAGGEFLIADREHSDAGNHVSVEGMLSVLPDDSRAVARALLVSGLSPYEAAFTLGLPVHRVKKMAEDAKSVLRECYAESA